MAEAGLSFAGLLRQLRAEARLTQEELAEAAGLSPRSVSDLERGINRTAHKDTAQLLAGALGLPGPVGELFVAAARDKAPAADVLAARQGVAPGAFTAAATRALPRDLAAFTGRQAELARLLGAMDALASDGAVVGIHAIDGMAGIGKTTFAVHAAHRLAAGFPDGQFFLPLHAHTPGQRPVDPADALASLLLTAGLAPQQIPPGTEARAARWRDHLAGKKILLLLDDAASHDQVRPLLPGTAGSVVLITSRRRLTALEDATVISLDTLPPGEAAELLARLAGQADLAPEAWLEADRANLHAAADYAAGRARFSHAFAIPAAISGFLAARGHWDQSAALHHSALAAARQAGDRLGEADTLGTLGELQRGTGDHLAAAASLAQALALYQEAGDQRGQAYPLSALGFLRVLTGDYPAAAASHQQALVLFGDLGDLHGQAWALGGLGLLQQLTGDHPAAATSLQESLALFGDLGDLHGQAQALNALGVVQQETGDHPAAAASQRQALALFGNLGHRLGQAYALNDLGLVQQETGDYPAAAASHQQALALFADLGNRLGQAEALNRLGELSLRTSATGQARDQHTRALAIARDIKAAPEEARALEGLGHSHLQNGNPGAAAAHLQQALTIYQRIGAPAARRVQQTLAKSTQNTLGGYSEDTQIRTGDNGGYPRVQSQLTGHAQSPLASFAHTPVCGACYSVMSPSTPVLPG